MLDFSDQRGVHVKEIFHHYMAIENGHIEKELHFFGENILIDGIFHGTAMQNTSISRKLTLLLFM